MSVPLGAALQRKRRIVHARNVMRRNGHPFWPHASMDDALSRADLTFTAAPWALCFMLRALAPSSGLRRMSTPLAATWRNLRITPRVHRASRRRVGSKEMGMRTAALGCERLHWIG